MSAKPLLSIIVSSPQADKIHLALTTASHMASKGSVSMFFTKGALLTLTKGGWDKLKDYKGFSGSGMDKFLSANGVRDSQLLIDSCILQHVRFLACNETLKIEGLTTDDLLERPVIMTKSLNNFLEEGEKGGWLQF